MIKAGAPCPRCGQPITKHMHTFYHYALGTHPGLVCLHCKMCWDDPDNSFIGAVMKWAKERSNEDQDSASQ